jgi:5-methylcytosine-specific restriction protein A
MRKVIRKAIRWDCEKCHCGVFASAIDVDHIVPLAHGGEDIDSNIQALCRACHKLKTRSDFSFAKPPF